MNVVLTMAALAGFFLTGALVRGAAIPAEYYASPMRWNDDLRGTATDVSFLNAKPAGVNGAITVRGEEFIESKTGKPIRFFGIGMGGRSVLDLDRESARKVAARLAKNGVNIVRFHNLDGANPRDSILDTSAEDTRKLDAKRLDVLDYLVHCLKEEGIYVVMPLKVNRRLKTGDGVPAGTGHKFVGRFDRRWIELQKEFARNFLLHVNPYTKLSAAEDPAVMGIEINNEDCLYRPWVDTPARIRELTPFHRAELEKLWQTFRSEQHLPELSLEHADASALAAFLTELDRRYNREMHDFLRRELQVKPLIVDTQMDWGGLAGLVREEPSDYIDSHGYWNHPEFRGTPWKFTRGNWYVRNESQLPYLAGKKQCKLTELASWRVAGKPFSISEYDYPYPCDYTVEMMPLLALIASRQGWNKMDLFIHGMTGQYDAARINGMFDQTNHPGKIGFFPAAALIYRTGMFGPAGTRETLVLPSLPHCRFKNQFDRAWEGTAGGKWRDLNTVRTSVSSRFLPDAEAAPVSQVIRGTAPAGEIGIEDENGRGFLRANSSRARILIGDLGGRTNAVGGFSVTAQPFPGNFGAAVLVSRTDQPIETSDGCLLTIAGRFDNAGIQFNRRRNSTQVSAGTVPGLIDCQVGAGPVIGTRLAAEIVLPASSPRQVYALNLDGSRKREIPATWRDGALSFAITPDQESMYYEIVSQQKR